MEKHILDLLDMLQGAPDTDSKVRLLDEITEVCAIYKDRLPLDDAMDLVQDVESTVVDSKPAVACDHINRLPDEMLVNIFKLHIKSEHVRRNTSLMPVCKRWKALVDSTPLLWNRIEATPHSSLRNVETCAEMVEFCIQRSGNAPLDLTLDLRRLWDPSSIPHERVGPYLFADPWEEHYEEDVLQNISGVAIENFILFTMDLARTFVSRSKTVEERVADAQASTNGAQNNDSIVYHMGRWRSFRLFFSEWMNDDHIPQFFRIFEDPAPNLEILEISHQSKDPNWIDDARNELYNGAFSDLHSLRTLSINSVIDLSQFPDGRNSMQSMSFVPSPASFPSLPDYPNLRSLHLTLDDLSVVTSGLPQTNVTLPQLTTLFLSGERSDVLLTLIDAPMLRRLRLSSPIPLTYPASQLFNTIHLLEWDVYLKENQDDIRRSLSAVLKQCIQLVDFATRVVHWRSSSDPMKQIVQEIMTEHPLKELRTITYFIPVAKKFEADEILETVTLASH